MLLTGSRVVLCRHGVTDFTASGRWDGRGGADPEQENATGLRGMAQRVESIGGRLKVSSPEGAGTRLTITAPLTPPWGTEGREDEQMDAPQETVDQTLELSPAAAPEV